uniref:Uncharacterized protein n=1 Tax=Anguilla anguilla TaxID=7936 RepID=A0A0E9UCC9_ANGAN
MKIPLYWLLPGFP